MYGFLGGNNSRPNDDFPFVTSDGKHGDMVVDTARSRLYIYVNGFGWVYTTASVPRGAAVIDRVYVSGGDTNGIFYYIGTGGLLSTFVNPQSAGVGFSVFVKTAGSAAILAITDRANNAYCMGSDTSNYCVFDLGVGRSTSISKYVFQYENTASNNIVPRNWKLQGSNNVTAMTTGGITAALWDDIDVRVSDTTMTTTANAFYAFTPSVGNTNRYRWIRILVTGNNSRGDGFFGVAEVELYGSFMTPV